MLKTLFLIIIFFFCCDAHLQGLNLGHGSESPKAQTLGHQGASKIFSFFGHVACGILFARPGIELMAPSMEAWSLNT